MSSLTDEWHLKRENGIKYWIDIRNFNKKKNWPCGKEIYSRKFKISESVFSICIYPNGNTSKEKGHVSVYLRNDSRWRVRLSDVTFKVDHHEETCASHYYQAEETWGKPKFVSHEQIKTANLLDKDRLTLEVDVELLEEEVVASRAVDSEGDALLSLQNEVCTIKEELESQKTEIQKISWKLNQLYEILKKLDAKSDPILESPSAYVSS